MQSQAMKGLMERIKAPLTEVGYLALSMDSQEKIYPWMGEHFLWNYGFRFYPTKEELIDAIKLRFNGTVPSWTQIISVNGYNHYYKLREAENVVNKIANC